MCKGLELQFSIKNSECAEKFSRFLLMNREKKKKTCKFHGMCNLLCLFWDRLTVSQNFQNPCDFPLPPVFLSCFCDAAVQEKSRIPHTVAFTPAVILILSPLSTQIFCWLGFLSRAARCHANIKITRLIWRVRFRAEEESCIQFLT